MVGSWKRLSSRILPLADPATGWKICGMEQQTRLEKFRERYVNGETPWDGDQPPPEVIGYVAHNPAGRALDLGCGYGRTCIYLAQHGWQAHGVDFVPEAIAGANQRAAEKGVMEQVRFFVGPVNELPFLQQPYDLIVDVGCMHGLPPAELRGYRDEVTRLLTPGGVYLLFAHLAETADESERWITETAVTDLFAESFELTRVEHGTTQVGDHDPWRSAWFWYRRR